MASAYINITKYIGAELGEHKVLESVPNLPVFLEIGASSKTMIGLISLGVTRFTASKIMETGFPSENDQESILIMLSERYQTLDIPRTCIREIGEALSKRGYAV